MVVELCMKTSSVDAKLSSVLKLLIDKEWIWRPARCDDMIKIQSKRHDIINLKEQDSAIWTVSSSGKHEVAITWNQLSSKRTVQSGQF